MVQDDLERFSIQPGPVAIRARHDLQIRMFLFGQSLMALRAQGPHLGRDLTYRLMKLGALLSQLLDQFAVTLGRVLIFAGFFDIMELISQPIFFVHGSTQGVC